MVDDGDDTVDKIMDDACGSTAAHSAVLPMMRPAMLLQLAPCWHLQLVSLILITTNLKAFQPTVHARYPLGVPKL